MNGLITSIVHRPYVFAFLAAYLFLAWRLWGWRRALIWLVSGYLVAWASEYSSIHSGFPYGEYHYIYENMPGELMVAGVPFFDSLSYPFLIFAGYTTAEYLLDVYNRAAAQSFASRGRISVLGADAGFPSTSPRAGKPASAPLELGRARRDRTIARILLGAVLTMLLDIIIDPVANLGDRWFLGKIYYYAHGGWYFGVPWTNFAGWFLVPLVVIVFNVISWRAAPVFFRGGSDDCMKLLYPAFYTAIALFNIAISFWIGAWQLGLASSGILLVVVVPMLRRSQ